MKLPHIELADVSRYRGELMGIAMILIVLFHVPLGRGDAFFGLHRIGNVGVDMFLFLSGMGLWFAWRKNRLSPLPLPVREGSEYSQGSEKQATQGGVKQAERDTTPLPHREGQGGESAWGRFYLRRFARIMPAWLIMACLFYVPDFLGARKYSQSLIDLIGDVTINWDFWLHDELTFWYIPATMVLYLVAPFYMELIRRWPIYRWLPVLMVMWCVAVQWVIPIHQAVGHLEIFWSRVPIFFIGVNMGELVRRKDRLDGSALWLLLLMFVAAFSASLYLEQVRHGKFPLFAERMIYIPLTVCGILLICQLLRRVPARLLRAMAFVGTVSLETYLIHVHFVMKPIAQYHLGYWPTCLLTIAISLPLAWLLHKLTQPIINLILKK